MSELRVLIGRLTDMQMALDQFAGDGDKVILPDADYVYFRDMDEYVQGLRASPDPRIVLLTVNPYLVDRFEPHEVILCLSGRRTRCLADANLEGFLDEFKLGEVWANQTDERLYCGLASGEGVA